MLPFVVRPASARVALAALSLSVLPSTVFAQLAGSAGVVASVPAHIGPFELRAGRVVERLGSRVATRTSMSVESTIGLTLRRTGFWLGASAMQAQEIASLRVRPLLEFGAWRTLGRVTV